MRKLSYHCAVSLDGFVARPNGSFDCFLMTGPHVEDFLATFDRYDTALMGRRTFEVGAKLGVTNPYPNMDTYVFSRTMEASPDPAVTLVSKDAADVVRGLKQKPGKDIWLVGAGDLASTLFAEGLVDELTLKLNPILLGAGIPLVARLEKPHGFQLTASKPYENGVVLLTYRVAVRSA